MFCRFGLLSFFLFFFFFNDTATTEIYTLSLHDALPIYDAEQLHRTLIAHGGGDAWERAPPLAATTLLFAVGRIKPISKLLGQMTHQSEHVSHSGDRFGIVLKQVSKSTQETARPLLTPGEVLHLPSEDALLFVGGLYPYRAKKVLYYEDKKFRARAAMKPPTPAQVAAVRGGRELVPRPPSRGLS